MPTDPEVGIADLQACRDAEEYFALLGVDYDQRVLDVNRLHILRAFAAELDALRGTGSPAGTGELRAALRRAHDTFATSTALDHRLFSVLRTRAPRGFVALDAVSVDGVEGDDRVTARQQGVSA